MIFLCVFALFFLIPISFVFLFGISVLRYVFAVSKNKRYPNFYSEEQMQKRKTWLIVSAIITAVLMVILITLIIIINTFSISFM